MRSTLASIDAFARLPWKDVIIDCQGPFTRSAKGNCYDNACAESLFQGLKVESIHDERFSNRAQMRETVFEYIETDYNRQRRHSTLGHISPEAGAARGPYPLSA